MNIGETSDNMSVNGVNIYSKEYGPWEDKAKELNANRGQESVVMAESQGIELTDTAKEAIISSSKGGTLNKMGITLKVAQTMEAIQHTRWSRGEKKDPAKDLAETKEIVGEELDFMIRSVDEEQKEDIKESMLNAAQEVYVARVRNSIRSIVDNIVNESDREISTFYLDEHLTESKLTDKTNQLLSIIPAEKIDELLQQIEEEKSKGYASKEAPLQIESNIGGILNKWEKELTKGKEEQAGPGIE